MQLLNIALLLAAVVCFFLGAIKRPETNVAYGWLGAVFVAFDMLVMALANFSK